VENKDPAEPPKNGVCSAHPLAVITSPSRFDTGGWLARLAYCGTRRDVQSQVDNGMTHSLYINDPATGYGVELLYELQREVWEG